VEEQPNKNPSMAFESAANAMDEIIASSLETVEIIFNAGGVNLKTDEVKVCFVLMNSRAGK
jgi:hypothetical protein